MYTFLALARNDSFYLFNVVPISVFSPFSLSYCYNFSQPYFLFLFNRNSVQYFQISIFIYLTCQSVKNIKKERIIYSSNINIEYEPISFIQRCVCICAIRISVICDITDMVLVFVYHSMCCAVLCCTTC